MSTNYPHDIIVDLALNEAARNSETPVTDNFAGVIFCADGRNFEGMLDLRKIPALYRDKTYRVPVYLVDPEFSTQFLKPGVRFYLWRGVKIGEGLVVSCNAA